MVCVHKHIGNSSSRKSSLQTIGNSCKLQADVIFLQLKKKRAKSKDTLIFLNNDMLCTSKVPDKNINTLKFHADL